MKNKILVIKIVHWYNFDILILVKISLHETVGRMASAMPNLQSVSGEREVVVTADLVEVFSIARVTAPIVDRKRQR